MMINRKIGVLYGGLSAARDVSQRSGEAVLRALAERGYDASPIFVDRDVDLVLRQKQIDVAFLALCGRYGEDGCTQGFLELLGIPYTGSSVLASSLAMNKAKAKEIFRLHNLPTAPGYLFDSASGAGESTALEAVAMNGTFGYPVVVKPVGESSSLGVSLARDELELELAVEQSLRFDDQVLVERYIEGKEISVAILDGQPLGAVEIVRRASIYDFRTKHTPGRSELHLPARLSPERYRSVLRLGVMAHEALGCEGATRVDLIVNDRGNEVVLEVNTLPDLTPQSLYGKIAQAAGLSFPDLIEEILRGARLRAHGHRRDRRGIRLGFEGPDRRAGTPLEAH